MSKKSLPVLHARATATEADEADGVEPSILIWTSVGIVFAFVLWLPLSYFAAKLGASSVQELAGASSADELARRIADLPEAARASMQIRVASFQLLALLLSHLAAGAIVARFGTKTSLRAWTIVGLTTSLLTVILASVTSGFTPFALLPVPLAAAASAGGGWLARHLAR